MEGLSLTPAAALLLEEVSRRAGPSPTGAA